MTESEFSAAQVAQQATLLLRARAPERTQPQAPALAREAARLLGVERPRSVADSSAPALSAFERQRVAQAQAKPAGWMNKLREVFGVKKP
jgi:hypothetical protein